MDNKLKKCSLAFTEHQIAGFMSNYKNLETNVTNLFAKPPLAVEATIIAINNGVEGALFRLLLSKIGCKLCSVLQLTPALKLNVTPRSQIITARNFGVLAGVEAGISHVMKKLQGKEDLQTRLVVGFGAGLAYSVARRDPPELLVVTGVICALFEAGLFKVIIVFLPSGYVDDMLYLGKGEVQILAPTDMKEVKKEGGDVVFSHV
ncbi:hypothetical protein QVD17_17482 [Tagetes erecta]|uniref:Uncharacterized protein n=1 Tax=Tagetes erecta TaxID=13708 RepID=A0AAD8P0C5_TARER|nr:hypothetical protein QVD17_17482 [Tagetes erecta]